MTISIMTDTGTTEMTIDADDQRLIDIAETKQADSPAFESLITRCKSRAARSRIRKIFHEKWTKFKNKI